MARMHVGEFASLTWHQWFGALLLRLRNLATVTRVLHKCEFHFSVVMSWSKTLSGSLKTETGARVCVNNWQGPGPQSLYIWQWEARWTNAHEETANFEIKLIKMSWPGGNKSVVALETATWGNWTTDPGEAKFEPWLQAVGSARRLPEGEFDLTPKNTPIFQEVRK